MVYSLTHDPLISDISRLPSGRGVSPFGEPIEAGGWCTQTPLVPIWCATVPFRLITSTRQFWTSATVTWPLRSR